ncbi:Uncharacterized protein GBIM_00961 [Gryllus bimaculatus]|nr:Uncharacterized protein GBIM_00961 [Gryllus bimaculatus]
MLHPTAPNSTWNSTEYHHDNNNECFLLIPTNDPITDQDDNNSEKPSHSEVWGFGMLSVGIISLSGLFGGLFWPLMSSKYYDHAMRMLIGLAVGTLTATSAMQLIPQGFGMKETDVDSYIQTSVIMLGSIWSLYMFEICCKIFFHSGNKTDSDVEMSAQKLSTVNEENIKQKTLEQEGLLPTIVTDSTNRKPSLKPYFSSNTSLSKAIPEKERKPSLRRMSHAHAQQIQMGGMAPVAWMVILGDGLHNFVDGMSIGAGFTNSLATGLSISIAIACEEFPHELGDFAILINSGMPVKKALMYNFLSALTAVAGLILGILLGELEASTYIFAFSGGLFLYISLTDLMPELNSMIEEGLKKNKKTSFLVLFQQNCGIIFGFCLLYVISSNPVTVT